MTLNLPDYSDAEILETLKPYQQGLISQLLVEHHGDAEAVAKIWLSASGPLDLRQFGGEQAPGGDTYYQLFRAEFREYVCGGKTYENDRAQVMKVVKPVASYVVTAISLAIASTLGIAVGLIVPGVALMLKMVGKIGVSAYCKLEK